MEATIEMDCSNYTHSLLKIIELIEKIGWHLSSINGYLPLCDEDDYFWKTYRILDWKTDCISDEELKEIVKKKQKVSEITEEIVGVHFLKNNGDEGFTFIANNTKEISLNLVIDRRTTDGRHTDFEWYKENIIDLLQKYDAITSYKFEDYED